MFYLFVSADGILLVLVKLRFATLSCKRVGSTRICFCGRKSARIRLVKFINKMGTKRPNNSVVLAQEPKRSKNDIMAYTNRDKALLESVSKRRVAG